ncbi:hypothetical protein NL526_28125, partial [Klebsiella pneumoniae]|nr:hypothetical protein [Klebsiella pneumoniae]
TMATSSQNASLENLITQAAGSILALKKAVGIVDQPFGDLSNPNVRTVGSAADAALAVAAVSESVTLLKNDNGLLPLLSTAWNGKTIMV